LIKVGWPEPVVREVIYKVYSENQQDNQKLPSAQQTKYIFEDKS
jgi:hypothetical protein